VSQDTDVSYINGRPSIPSSGELKHFWMSYLNFFAKGRAILLIKGDLKQKEMGFILRKVKAETSVGKSSLQPRFCRQLATGSLSDSCSRMCGSLSVSSSTWHIRNRSFS